MEDFKLIFYIGIAIAWFVYKNYQKVQQNRPKTIVPPKINTETAGGEKTPAAIALEKIRRQKQIIEAKKSEIKKDFRANQKTKESKPVLKDEIKKKASAPVSFLNVDIPQERGKTLATAKKDAEAIMETKKNSEDDLFDLKKFDIRTAIIYSEILKRPYV